MAKPPAGNASPETSTLAKLKGQGKKLEGRLWKPENDGDFMIGRLTRIDHEIGDYDSDMARFRDVNNNEVGAWCKGTLKTKLDESLVGRVLLVEYRGTVPSKKAGSSPMNVYDVYDLGDEFPREAHEIGAPKTTDAE